MKTRIARWAIFAASAGLAGCAHDAAIHQVNGLERLSRRDEGRRVIVEVYLLDQGADGLAAGFPAVGGNADPERAVPVANGCPTEDGANVLLRFLEPIPGLASLDGRRATVSGVYRAQETFLEKPSLNLMVYYGALLEEVQIEHLHDDSCAKWEHSGGWLRLSAARKPTVPAP
jgi:hypothetical protein